MSPMLMARENVTHVDQTECHPCSPDRRHRLIDRTDLITKCPLLYDHDHRDMIICLLAVVATLAELYFIDFKMTYKMTMMFGVAQGTCKMRLIMLPSPSTGQDDALALWGDTGVLKVWVASQPLGPEQSWKKYFIEQNADRRLRGVEPLIVDGGVKGWR
ncbi:hypothetical protein Btru_011234 [Bulinus truncatus]|nr:hypothetical protein Btru_011234 [Bulinus truncatus]